MEADAAASVEESALRSSDPSEEVRAFYERHPYPPPLGNLDRHRELYRDPGRRQALSLLLWPTRRPTPDRRDSDRGLWHVAGRHSRNARAGRAGDGDRHQRVQPQPHARSSREIFNPESRSPATRDRRRRASSARPSTRSSAPACSTTCPTRTLACGHCALLGRRMGRYTSWSMRRTAVRAST